MIKLSLLTIAILSALIGAPALADDPIPLDAMPRTSRYASTRSFLQGGEQERAGLEAENERMPGADESAVELSELDAEGNYKSVHFRLEIAEVQEEVFPGEYVTFWVYAPLGTAMGTPARLPSPTLRVQQGDHVRITLYNTHYLPHTIHLHGMSQSWDMDGVPDMPRPDIKPGENFSYDFIAKSPGTYWYHCHVQEQVHVPMGLAGMFIVEPRRPNNHFARMIPGAGRVQALAKATADSYQGEYSLVYQDVDSRLHRIPAVTNDVREIEKRMHRDYDITQGRSDIFLLNGRAFPFTLRDSTIEVKSGETTKLRVLNVGAHTVYLHPHGHHPLLTDVDGFAVPEAARVRRDVFDIGPGQRVDLALGAKPDGMEASGPGAWMMHDHSPVASTNKGIGPGGAHSEIAYAGTPAMANHEAHARYFDPAWYRGEAPVFGGADVPLEKRGDLDYPVRVTAVPVPRLDLLDLERHRIVADACGEKARGFRKLTIKAGRAYARPDEAYGFEPRHLEAGRCQEVEITFDIEDSIRHTFMLPGLNPMFAINFIGPGTRTARFITPDADVSLFFHCHVPAHDKTGMTGELIIGKGGPARGAKIEQVQVSGSAEGVGTIIATIPRAGRLVIDHEEIKGFMAAMEMAYSVAQPGLLDDLGAGDRIRFTIDKSRNTITSVTVLSKGQ
jgi:FtsP/CotA-like multicopper oxidase with cupredoxin domain/Cu/Ag efflux protein CusF